MMKGSGIEWVGNIPESWSVCPAGGLFAEVKEKNKNLKYTNPLQFKFGEIVDKAYVGEMDENMLDTISTYTCVEPDTIMINGLNLNYDFVTQRVAIVTKPGVITSAYLAVYPDKNLIMPRFASYLLKAYDSIFVLHGMGSGVRKTLQWKDFKNLKFVLPSIESQSAIITELDSLCGKADALIANVQAQIEKLKAYKQSIITEVVTKGLDPTVPMKDSGNDYIGTIPAHWKAMKLKYFCTMQAGKNLISEQIAEQGEYPVYGGNGLRGYFDASNYNGSCLLVGRQGALCGNVHLVSGEFWATEHAVITEPKNDTLLNYLYYLLVGINLNQYVSPTAAQPGLSVSTVQNIISCYAPVREQKAIVEYLNRKCPEIDRLIAIKEAKIEKLEQYKKSLIYEYVTGKKEA